MEPTIYIPVIAALVGAFVGASIKELSSFYVMRREDKRILKKVLFNQLDVWYEVRRLYFGPLLSLGLKKMGDRLRREGIPEEVINSQLEQQQPLFASMFSKMRLGEPSKFQQRYQDAVDEMAKVDPVLAFRISGRPEFENDLGKLDKFVDTMTEASATSVDIETIRKLLGQFGPTFEELTVIRTLKSLQEDIWRVSRRIGFLTCFRTLWLMQQIKARTAREHDPEGDKLLDTYLSLIMPLLKTKVTSPPQVNPEPAKSEESKPRLETPSAEVTNGSPEGDR